MSEERFIFRWCLV